MPIKLKSTGGGDVTLDVPNTAATSTITFPATNGTVILSDSSGNAGVTGNLSVSGTVAMGSSFMRNRIINGDMRIFQRGISAATDGAYCVDRWVLAKGNSAVTSTTQSTDVPSGRGFQYSLKTTVTTASGSVGASQYELLRQIIEGYNVADLNWGTSSALSITLSFWVKSSVSGLYCGSITNGPTEDKICPFSYTINSSNTWEYKTVTVPGSTSSSGVAWNANNDRGVIINWYTLLGSNFQGGAAGVWGVSPNFGVSGATNALATIGNTFAITGCQFEVGTASTPFERRLITQELAYCQRYYEKSFPQGTTPANAAGLAGAIAQEQFATGHNYLRFSCVPFAVEKRTSPTLTFYNPNTASTSPSGLRAGSEDGNTGKNNSLGDRSNFRSTRFFFPLLDGTNQGGNSQFDVWCTQWTADAEL
jgi:hypothetical protein